MFRRSVISKSWSRYIRASLAALLLFVAGCTSAEEKPPGDDTEIIDAADSLTHEELQSEDYGPVINYGNHGFVDGPLHEVIVDGKKRKDRKSTRLNSSHVA